LFSLFPFQCFDVGQVLRPRGREFVLNQVFSGEHSDRLIGEFGTHPVCPSFFESDTVDRGNTSIRIGSTPIWKTRLGVERSFSVKSCNGAPKARRASMTRFAFSRVGRTPKSEIWGRSDMPMCGQGVRADQEKFNLPGVEFC